MQDGFSFQRSEPRHFRDQSRKQGAHDRRGEAAARDLLGRMVVPRQSYIYSARGKLNQVPRLVEEGMIFIEARHVDRDHTGEVTRPFRRGEVVVIARGNKVNALEISFVDPFLVLEDMLGQSAAKATVQDMVVLVDRLPDAFANDHGARAQVLAEDTKAP